MGWHRSAMITHDVGARSVQCRPDPPDAGSEHLDRTAPYLSLWVPGGSPKILNLIPASNDLIIMAWIDSVSFQAQILNEFLGSVIIPKIAEPI